MKSVDHCVEYGMFLGQRVERGSADGYVRIMGLRILSKVGLLFLKPKLEGLGH